MIKVFRLICAFFELLLLATLFVDRVEINVGTANVAVLADRDEVIFDAAMADVFADKLDDIFDAALNSDGNLHVCVFISISSALREVVESAVS